MDESVRGVSERGKDETVKKKRLSLFRSRSEKIPKVHLNFGLEEKHHIELDSVEIPSRRWSRQPRQRPVVVETIEGTPYPDSRPEM